MNLKAYCLDGVETWAGVDAADAVQAAIMNNFGPNADPRDCYEGEEIVEIDREVTVRTSERGEAAEYTTVGAILDRMTSPGLVCSTEY